MASTLLSLAAFCAQLGIIVATVAATLALARVRSPRLRLGVWQAGLLAGLTAPVVAAAIAGPTPSLVAEPLRVAAAAAGAAATTGALTVETWCAVTVACLVAGTVCRAVWVLAGWRRLRQWAARPAATSPDFDRAAAELGVNARLVCADEVRSPFTFGHASPVVVVPSGLLDDPRTARAVFLHELAHVSRRDWCFVLAEEAVRALLWFHPAAWWATAEIRLAREEIVDRAAAARLGSRRAYLEALLTASQTGDPAWRLVSALIHRHQLARRVRALAAEVSMNRRHATAAVLAVGLSITCAAWAAAGTFPVWAAPHAAAATAPDDDVEKPVPTRKVEAVYPPEAKEKGIEGEVALDVTIGADGLVKDAKVVKSIPELDDAALTAIRQWEFRPGRKNGKAVEVLTTITFSFRLK